jgi:hypothetical protein
LLQIVATRPAIYGLERHLVSIHRQIGEMRPSVVVIDPITSLISNVDRNDVIAMTTRLIDYLKSEKITAFFVTLSNPEGSLEMTEIRISSLMDTWLLLRDIELNGERNRGMYILKSRGMAHSNQIREFVLTNKGIRLLKVYLGREGVLTGSARVAQEAREKEAVLERAQRSELTAAELARKRKSMEAKIAAMRRSSKRKNRKSPNSSHKMSGGSDESKPTAPRWPRAAGKMDSHGRRGYDHEEEKAYIQAASRCQDGAREEAESCSQTDWQEWRLETAPLRCRTNHQVDRRDRELETHLRRARAGPLSY